MPTSLTPRARLLDLLLEAEGHGGLLPFVQFHRADDRSWRWIAARISAITEQPVSHESLRLWAQEDRVAA